ncbi:hypothetical protein H257_02239 [Aphanomyces astaci]|uniref:ATP-dependent DNA helicase n=1 Tax=Aphanomyces astaci TaxID=112090 RepID=W4H0V6_APHAT|nr:hypothetical protein H257_02239 [Aphanomyces astaci]ETV85620.1 hypothetical protein H257_02239 [Aphanomyces astaci]|eukprot:XP_009824092.1 hypothetical protein H257_02239 [Aphanomyces astaci]
MPFGPNGTRLPDETVLFVIATLESALQVHWWSHCSSCFKQSRNARGAQMWRYLFPRARVEVGLIGTSAILLVRKLGEEYINGYSDVILRAFKCNHDIQIMIGGAEMAERIYYACKYTTKDQQKVECRTALALAAFDTRIQRELSTAESGKALSDEVKCRRRLASHMFNMTRKQEVAGPLCALYLLRESCAYTGHFYKKMSIRQNVLKFLHQHSDTPFQLEVTTNIKVKTLTPLTLKVTRKKMLHHLLDQGDLDNQAYSYRLDISWFEFTSKFFRANRADGTSSDKLFMERHSLHKSKCIGVHRLARIPVLTGGVRVPFFGDCLKPEERDFHAQVALVLFKPFRVLSDLCPHGSTWHEAWESFQPTMSTGSAEMYHFMQDYHVGRKKAAKTRTSREEEQNIQMENDDGHTEPDDFDDIDFENALPVASRHPATSHLDCDDARDTTSELYQAVSSSEMSNQVKFPTTTPIDADIAALVGGQSLDEASTTASSSYMSILGAWDQRLRCREQFASDVKGLKTWMSKKRVERVVTFENQSRVEESSEASVAWCTDPPSEIQTLVQANVPGALEPSTMFDGNLKIMEITTHEVSPLQRAPYNYEWFCTVKGVLESRMSSLLPPSQSTEFGMHNLTPSTVHEAKEADEKGVPGYTEDLKLLLVDEMSMMNKQQLVRLDEALRARTKLDLPFGGINVVLAGDFFQMPPVGGKPLYTPLSAYQEDLKFDLYEDTGFHLWRSFKDVVVLNENVQFSQDPE